MTPKLIWQVLGRIKNEFRDLEELLACNGLKNPAKTVPPCPFTLEQVGMLYETIIGKSWGKSSDFELFQAAWNIIADKWQILGNTPEKLRFKEEKKPMMQKPREPDKPTVYILCMFTDYEDMNIISVHSTREKAEIAAKHAMDKTNYPLSYQVIGDEPSFKTWKNGHGDGYVIYTKTVDL